MDQPQGQGRRTQEIFEAMNINEGASHEINSRWPEYKQRNCGLNPHWYGPQYFSDMLAGIQLVRDQHAALEAAGKTQWEISAELTAMLDQLAGIR